MIEFIIIVFLGLHLVVFMQISGDVQKYINWKISPPPTNKEEL